MPLPDRAALPPCAVLVLTRPSGMTGGGGHMHSEGIEQRLAALLRASLVGCNRFMANDGIATIRMPTTCRGGMPLVVPHRRGRLG